MSKLDQENLDYYRNYINNLKQLVKSRGEIIEKQTDEICLLKAKVETLQGLLIEKDSK